VTLIRHGLGEHVPDAVIQIDRHLVKPVAPIDLHREIEAALQARAGKSS